jgi:hypothetical protein
MVTAFLDTRTRYSPLTVSAATVMLRVWMMK